MKHLGTKELKTKRLLLRRLTMDDADDMFNNWASDPLVTKYLIWSPHENVDVTKGSINKWLNKYENLDFYQWGIEIIETKELIGTISVVNFIDKLHTAEFGYCIGQKYWGKGYVPEALNRMIEFLFNEVGVNRIEGQHEVENINSGKVMKKCGLEYEGRLRSRGHNKNGEFIDLEMYAIIKEDYLHQ